MNISVIFRTPLKIPYLLYLTNILPYPPASKTPEEDPGDIVAIFYGKEEDNAIDIERENTAGDKKHSVIIIPRLAEVRDLRILFILTDQ